MIQAGACPAPGWPRELLLGTENDSPERKDGHPLKIAAQKWA